MDTEQSLIDKNIKRYSKVGMQFPFKHSVKIYNINEKYHFYSANGVSLLVSEYQDHYLYEFFIDVYLTKVYYSYTSTNFLIENINHSIIFQLKLKNAILLFDKLLNAHDISFSYDYISKLHYLYCKFSDKTCISEFVFYYYKDDNYFDDCNLYYLNKVISFIIVKNKKFSKTHLFRTLDGFKYLAQYSINNTQLIMEHNAFTNKGSLTICHGDKCEKELLDINQPDFIELLYHSLLTLCFDNPSKDFEKLILDYDLNLTGNIKDTLTLLDMIIV